MLDEFRETFVQCPSLFAQFALGDFYYHACSAQLLETSSRYAWIRIMHRRDHAADSGVKDGRCARAGASDMATWLEIDIERPTLGARSCLLQRHDLGVLLLVVLVEPPSHDLFIRVEYDRADGRIGRSESHTLA